MYIHYTYKYSLENCIYTITQASLCLNYIIKLLSSKIRTDMLFMRSTSCQTRVLVFFYYDEHELNKKRYYFLTNGKGELFSVQVR